MPTPKQKAAIEAIFKDRKKPNKDRVKDFGEDEFKEHGELEYLSNRELSEIRDAIGRGGYERLG